MGLVLFISAILCGIIFKKSKICTTYIFLVMYVFAAFRTYDADYLTYRVGYNNLGNSSIFRYAGYSSFLKLFSSLGFDFEAYNCIFYLIVFILLIVCIRLLTENVNLVLAAYLVYSYSLDVIQMKSAIADVFVLLCIGVILSLNADISKSYKKRKAQWIFAAVCLGIAVYMHFSTIYFVIAIAVYYMIRNRKNIGIIVMAISGIILFLLYSGFLVIIMRYANVLRILGDLDYMGRWALKSTRYGYLIYAIVILLIILSCQFNKFEMLIDDFQKEVSVFLMTSTLVFPFVYLNGQYSRLLRIYMIFVYIIFSKQQRSTKITYKRLLNNFFCFGAMIILFYFEIAMNYDNVLGALMKYNSIFGLPY